MKTQCQCIVLSLEDKDKKQTYRHSELENKNKEYDSSDLVKVKQILYKKPFIEKTRSAWFT
jgi:hypothetical protein